MQSQTEAAGSGRGTALARLLGLAAAAALLAVLWTAAGASARNGPTVAAEYAGWAGGGIDDSIAAEIRAGRFQIDQSAFGTQTGDLGAWSRANLRCHYLNVSWSGVTGRAPGSQDASFTILSVPQRPFGNRPQSFHCGEARFR